MPKSAHDTWDLIDDRLEAAAADYVQLRRGLMVFRARLDGLERVVARIDDTLADIEASYAATQAELTRVSERSRQTVLLCDALLQGCQDGERPKITEP